MDTRRLGYLLELHRLGSMREVADRLGTSTSTVSQQVAALAKDLGTALIEPSGRRVRLTPAGRRLAEHAVTILAAVDAAQGDLDPGAEPAGTVHVAGYATAVRRTLLPIVAELAVTHPGVQLIVHEHEPAEAYDLLDADAVDLALTYDYNLAPATPAPHLEATRLWSTAWGLGVPERVVAGEAGDTLTAFRAFRDHRWIGNSRNTADEVVLRTISSMAGFEPQVTHHADSLDLVEDLILAGLGVGLLPAGRPSRAGVHVIALADPPVTLRAYAMCRRGRSTWPPLRLVLGMLNAQPRGQHPG